MDISKLESDQAYATRNNEYPNYNDNEPEITREYMQKRIIEYYNNIIEEAKTPELQDFLQKALDSFISMAGWDLLEQEFERIEY